jgi:hypothetical protein
VLLDVAAGDDVGHGAGACSQNVALEGGVLVTPRLLHILLAVTDVILLLMCTPSVAICFSLCHQLGGGNVAADHTEVT